MHRKIRNAMYRIICALFAAIQMAGPLHGQENRFERIDFLVGEWSGTGQGFGNEKSRISSSFRYVMNGKYIQVVNDSKFEPTESDPQGEHHVDMGFFSVDGQRDAILYRQFNIEGYVNQYILNDSLSSGSILIFETEQIENLPGGKARWTIRILSENQIETVFDVRFPGREYTCLGTNRLTRKP